MANKYWRFDEPGNRPLPIYPQTYPQQSYQERNHESDSEQTFSPTGLLGERYDMLKQQMEARTRGVDERLAESPFTRGLVASLAQSEIEQRARNNGVSYGSASFDAGLSRAPSTAYAASYRSSQSTQDFGRPRRTSSDASRTDSIYCAQTGMTPGPLLDMSPVPQRWPPWHEQNAQVRSPTSQHLARLPENSVNQWNSSPVSPLSRSHSITVRSSSGTWASSNRSGSWPNPVEPTTLSRRVSSATAPARPETSRIALVGAKRWAVMSFQAALD
ncbi:hypothetical protein F53441_11702 [Fusarium austroafricanum]|uniref:Uncharacterized protein n=1 Tax=Fusarium austroafricanum TaxID=2364996 RepID=A0A8H4K321_9HYPO|nr:hypothetical protein F53441_11702 [Fusarium austroafricanum]